MTIFRSFCLSLSNNKASAQKEPSRFVQGENLVSIDLLQ